MKRNCAILLTLLNPFRVKMMTDWLWPCSDTSHNTIWPYVPVGKFSKKKAWEQGQCGWKDLLISFHLVLVFSSHSRHWTLDNFLHARFGTLLCTWLHNLHFAIRTKGIFDIATFFCFCFFFIKGRNYVIRRNKYMHYQNKYKNRV